MKTEFTISELSLIDRAIKSGLKSKTKVPRVKLPKIEPSEVKMPKMEFPVVDLTDEVVEKSPIDSVSKHVYNIVRGKDDLKVARISKTASKVKELKSEVSDYQDNLLKLDEEIINDDKLSDGQRELMKIQRNSMNTTLSVLKCRIEDLES